MNVLLCAIENHGKTTFGQILVERYIGRVMDAAGTTTHADCVAGGQPKRHERKYVAEIVAPAADLVLDEMPEPVLHIYDRPGLPSLLDGNLEQPQITAAIGGAMDRCLMGLDLAALRPVVFFPLNARLAMEESGVLDVAIRSVGELGRRRLPVVLLVNRAFGMTGAAAVTSIREAVARHVADQRPAPVVCAFDTLTATWIDQVALVALACSLQATPVLAPERTPSLRPVPDFAWQVSTRIVNLADVLATQLLLVVNDPGKIDACLESVVNWLVQDGRLGFRMPPGVTRADLSSQEALNVLLGVIADQKAVLAATTVGGGTAALGAATAFMTAAAKLGLVVAPIDGGLSLLIGSILGFIVGGGYAAKSQGRQSKAGALSISASSFLVSACALLRLSFALNDRADPDNVAALKLNADEANRQVQLPPPNADRDLARLARMQVLREPLAKLLAEAAAPKPPQGLRSRLQRHILLWLHLSLEDPGHSPVALGQLAPFRQQALDQVFLGASLLTFPWPVGQRPSWCLRDATAHSWPGVVSVSGEDSWFGDSIKGLRSRLEKECPSVQPAWRWERCAGS